MILSDTFSLTANICAYHMFRCHLRSTATASGRAKLIEKSALAGCGKTVRLNCRLSLHGRNTRRLTMSVITRRRTYDTTRTIHLRMKIISHQRHLFCRKFPPEFCPRRNISMDACWQKTSRRYDGLKKFLCKLESLNI